MIRVGLFAVLAATLWSACTVPGAMRTAGSVSAGMIHEAVAANQERIQNLRGSGRLSIETPEMAQTVSFELYLQKPDSVLVRLEGPFGIEVGSALLTRQEFQFYNGLENQLITGPTNPAVLSRLLRMKISFDDLLSLFAGGRFFDEDRPERGELNDEEGSLSVRYARGTETRRYRVDPRTLLIQRIEHAGRDGTVLAEQLFADFRPVDGTTLPHRMKVVFPRDRRMIAVAYSTLSVNGTPADLRLQVPANARRVILD